MTEAEAAAAVLRALASVAPEVDPGRLDPGRPLQDQVDLDSMDMLSLVEEIGRLTGLEVPDSDIAQLATPKSAARYLAARSGGG